MVRLAMLKLFNQAYFSFQVRKKSLVTSLIWSMRHLHHDRGSANALSGAPRHCERWRFISSSAQIHNWEESSKSREGAQKRLAYIRGFSNCFFFTMIVHIYITSCIGVGVDSMNHLGQTPLFCASLLGFASVAEKLLQYGANPNQ